jgi:disulfide bond formation protein DsbB
MIDGIKSFVTGLSTAAIVLRPEAVHEFTERIVNPRPAKKEGIPGIPAISEEKTQPPQNVSRARAIFEAAEDAKPFNPADFDFAMAEEGAAMETMTPSVQETDPATPLPDSRPQAQRVLGMTRPQLALIAVLAIALVCILAVFAYILFSPNPLLP